MLYKDLNIGDVILVECAAVLEWGGGLAFVLHTIWVLQKAPN